MLKTVCFVVAATDIQPMERSISAFYGFAQGFLPDVQENGAFYGIDAWQAKDIFGALAI